MSHPNKRAAAAKSPASPLRHVLLVLLTPVAGWIAATVGQLVPGVHVSTASLVALFVAGSLAALTVGLHYLERIHLPKALAALRDEGVALIGESAGVVVDHAEPAAIPPRHRRRGAAAPKDDVEPPAGRPVV